MFKGFKGGAYLSPFIIGLTSFLAGMFTGAMIHWPEFRHFILIAIVSFGITFGLAYMFIETRVGTYLMANQKAGMIRRRKFWAPKLDAFDLFKDWLYAKKMRVCPQIKVDL